MQSHYDHTKKAILSYMKKNLHLSNLKQKDSETKLLKNILCNTNIKVVDIVKYRILLFS